AHTRTGSEAGATVPIGRPVENVSARVLDRAGELVPAGVAGELYLGGVQLARGYLGRPGLTAERWVPDPFADEPGARLYRTGDRVRWLADGALEYLGRVDQQVKMRGFRIEPGEVESALRRHPGVRDAAVVVRGEGGDALLVGYFVPAGEPVDAAELRGWLRAGLPEHMVPGALVALEALPLTPGGKLDRRALPAPGAAAGEAYVAPRTPTEAALAEVFGAVLRRERVGVHDGFFELGGHSLLATRVVSRVRETLGVEVPLRALFEAPTVAALAERVEEASRSTGPAAGPIPRRPDGGPAPLSFAQQRLWFIHRLDPGSSAYNMPFALRLRGRLDVRALRRSLREIVRRHEAVRTSLVETGGEPVQVVLPAGPIPFPVADLAGLPEGPRRAEAGRRIAEEGGRPFDLARGPLLRALLLRLGTEEWALCFTMHHVIGDGWSTGVLTREVSALYGAFSRGEPSPLPELPIQYADFAAWQRGWLTGEVLDAQLRFWREQLAGAPPTLDLPADHPRRAPLGATETGTPFTLSPEATRGLRELGRRERATLFMALLAGWQTLLGRYAATDDVVVGSPIAGRTRAELEPLIGFFVNTLVLRADLGGDPTFRELLARVRETTLGAFAHQDLPFERLVEELAPERSLLHNPLFQVMFALQNVEGGRLALGDVEAEPLGGGDGGAKFDVGVTLYEAGERIVGGLNYRTDLFDASTIERMGEHFRLLLEGAVADPDRRISELRLVGPAEARRLLTEWNPARSFPAERLVPGLIADRAALSPDAPAVSGAGGTLTHAGLQRRSARLAEALRLRGVGPEVPVGVCLERGPELLVAVLGAWKAGGAYVPLDPDYPADRLAYVLEDSGARVLVTSAELAGRLPASGGEVVVLGADDGTPLHPAPSPARGEGENGATPDNLAYVIYTSGSTGRPKGVRVSHRNLLATLAAARERYDFRPDDRVAAVASFSFDIWLLEAVLPLLAGASVRILAREQVLQPERLLAGLEGATCLHAVPSLMRQAAEALRSSGRALAGMRQVFVGGEAVAPELLDALREVFPAATVRVIYGPTETTVICADHRSAAGEARRQWIGRPLGNATLFVLDGGMQPVPVRVPGELYIGGASVARDYLGRPELTAEKFVPDPFGREPGGRLYRSGDRVRWTAEGELEFLGRTDAQVKIRGFRIEPGEVEAVLAEHPGVAEAAVTVRGDAGGDLRLAAYAVPAAGDGAPDAAELRRWLAGRLPDYMVPAAVLVLEALPLTPSGKLDRRALPAPAEGGSAESYVAPRTPAEEAVARIFADVLRAGRVGAEDGFFALGGHSLLAMRVLSRVQEELGVELRVAELFEDPTVAGLARRIDAARREAEMREEAAIEAEEGSAAAAPGGLDGLSPERRLLLQRRLMQRAAAQRIPRRGDDGPAPLSFAQQRLWFIHQLDPRGAAYNMPVPLRLRGTLDVGVLRRAVSEVVRRHEALRTVFAVRDGETVQVVRPAGPVPLPVTDLAALPAARREAEARRLAEAESLRPFDLERGPLVRAVVLRLAPDDHAALFDMHHIVSDGWSMEVLTREVAMLYAAFARGEPSPLPELPIQYADFAVWQRARLAGEALEAQVAWWRERLADAPPLLEVPTDRPRRGIPGPRGGRRPVELPPETGRGLRELAAAEGATLFMTLLAAWQALLARWSGQDDVSVGTPIAGRTRAELEPLIGFFVNTLVLRADLGGDPTFRELLARVRET
ncbi:MAG TPA: amino acid adenylation domain-containing protein, partial [Longimicrobiaceae bacterium]|nr:amino acid adenylation domain-containing protein [Longimicrobiaceae bacterium]